MTPAINMAKKAKIQFTVHEYRHDPSADSYGEEAAHALGVNTDQVFKSLIIELNGKTNQLAVAVLPVSRRLDLKAYAAEAKVKKARMANSRDAERVTGYVLGGISPLGLRKRLPVLIDESVMKQNTVYVSAGKRGLQIELSPRDLVKLTDGEIAAISR